MKKIVILLILGFTGLSTFCQVKIKGNEASTHIGDSVIIVEKVYGGKLLKNGMTLLNLGGDFPNHSLVVMIKTKDRAKFRYKPEEQLIGKYIQVTGKLIEYKGKPEIIVRDPKQLVELVEKETPNPSGEIDN